MQTMHASSAAGQLECEASRRLGAHCHPMTDPVEQALAIFIQNEDLPTGHGTDPT